MAKIDVLAMKVGVRIVPYRRRRQGRETHARRTLTALSQQHGEGHVLFVLRAIVESKPNREELWSETISAVSDVVLFRRDLADRGLAFLEAFDRIPLGPLRAQAQATCVGIATTRQALGVLLVRRLDELLAAPVLPEAA